MITILLRLAVLLCALAIAAPGYAASFTPEQEADIVRVVREALKKDPSILQEAVQAIQADQARQQADTAHQAITQYHDQIFDEADPAVGAPHGITVVEFYDTRCPYCRQIEPGIRDWLRNSADVRIAYKDMPILGPPSIMAARALLAAQRQDGYAKLRELLMAAPPDFTMDAIHGMATEAGLDWARLQKDMADPAIQRRLESTIQLAKQLGIEGTPGFVVGNRLVIGSDLGELKDAVDVARGKK